MPRLVMPATGQFSVLLFIHLIIININITIIYWISFTYCPHFLTLNIPKNKLTPSTQSSQIVPIPNLPTLSSHPKWPVQ